MARGLAAAREILASGITNAAKAGGARAVQAMVDIFERLEPWMRDILGRATPWS